MDNVIQHSLPSLEQRYPIWSLRDTGKTLEAIDLLIGFDKNTVSRELKRNRDESGYKPKTAEKLSQSRQNNAHKASPDSQQLVLLIINRKVLKEQSLNDWDLGR